MDASVPRCTTLWRWWAKAFDDPGWRTDFGGPTGNAGNLAQASVMKAQGSAILGDPWRPVEGHALVSNRLPQRFHQLVQPAALTLENSQIASIPGNARRVGEGTAFYSIHSTPGSPSRTSPMS